MRKKLLSVVLALAVSLTCGIPAAAAEGGNCGVLHQ